MTPELETDRFRCNLGPGFGDRFGFLERGSGLAEGG
jgi:hypothetical protein